MWVYALQLQLNIEQEVKSIPSGILMQSKSPKPFYHILRYEENRYHPDLPQKLNLQVKQEFEKFIEEIVKIYTSECLE